MKIRSTLRRNFPTLRKNLTTLRNFQFRLRFCKHRCSRAFWHFSIENIVKSRVFRRILCQK